MPGETGADSPRFDDRDSAVVAVRGEIDIATADDMRDRLLAAAAGCAVVIADFTEVDFFDASGVRALMAARRRLAARGVRLMLGGPSAGVLRTLDVLGLAAEFPVLPVAELPFIPRPTVRR